MKYRHELKYQIDSKQLEELKIRLQNCMTLDPHVGEKGYYTIRSLYFDDYDNSCFYANEDGTDPREKFRLRIYNGADDRIRLELKRKEADKTLKKSALVDRAFCETVMAGDPVAFSQSENPVLNKFYLWQEMQGLGPKIIVEYDRIPYIHPDGNVRITLDMNMRSSLEVDRFLPKNQEDSYVSMRPIMPVGQHLLEVKYDEFLPDYIYHAISMPGLQRTTYSKYYLCRKFCG